MVTTDAQIYGNRAWARHHFTRPGHLTWRAMLDAARHPRWLAATMVRRRGMPVFENIIDFVPQEKRGFYDSAFWVRSQMDKGLDWTRSRGSAIFGRASCSSRACCAPTTSRARRRSAPIGVVLSNHGGRQLDSAVAGLDSLPEARRIVGDRLTILVDGGIRRGADVLKALALGADAVQIGRAALYGVAAAGQEGVTRSIEILRDDMHRALGLLGVASLAELGPELLAR